MENKTEDSENDDSIEDKTPNYKVVIELKEDKFEELYELTQYAKDTNIMSFNMMVDNTFYMLLYTDRPIEDGKIYSNSVYTKDEAENTSDELKSELK